MTSRFLTCFALLCLALACPHASAFVSESNPDGVPDRFSDGTMTLPGIVRQTMALHFGSWRCGKEGKRQSLAKFVEGIAVQERFRQPGGVFVTLSRNGRTRACWGSVNPQHGSISRACAYATVDAIRKDYRFKPIDRREWSKLHAQVTVVRALEPIEGHSQVNPLRDGVMVRNGGRAGVILPGEATDAHYEIVLAKLKAGIKPGEPCQLYKMKVEIYD